MNKWYTNIHTYMRFPDIGNFSHTHARTHAHTHINKPAKGWLGTEQLSFPRLVLTYQTQSLLLSIWSHRQLQYLQFQLSQLKVTDNLHHQRHSEPESRTWQMLRQRDSYRHNKTNTDICRMIQRETT